MAEYLTIRLSKDESKNLTRLRAAHEIAACARITVKDLLLKLVADAYKDHLSGKLQMPIYKTTPEIPAHVKGATDNAEQFSIKKRPEDKTALATIVYGIKRPLTYGQSDAVRELIKLAAAKLDKQSS